MYIFLIRISYRKRSVAPEAACRPPPPPQWTARRLLLLSAVGGTRHVYFIRYENNNNIIIIITMYRGADRLVGIYVVPTGRRRAARLYALGAQ